MFDSVSVTGPSMSTFAHDRADAHDSAAIDHAAIPRARYAPRAFEIGIVAVELAIVALAGTPSNLLPSPGAHAIGFHPLHGAAMAACYLLLILATGGAARPPRRARIRHAARAIGAIFAVGSLLALPPPARELEFALACAVSLLAIAGCRRAAMRVSRAVPALLPSARPIAFIGNSEAASDMLDRIGAEPIPLVRPIGYFDDRAFRPGPLDGRLPRLGDIDDITRFIHERELHEVFMALPWTAGPRIASLVERLRFLPLTVRLLPDHVPRAIRRHDAWQVEGVVMPTLMVPPLPVIGAALKRATDLAVSLLLLIPLSPILLATAIAIRLDSPGPIFFLQPRSGRFGRQFRIFKFRSLHVARADTAAETLVGRNDQRVTRVGRFIRRYSIDELPQIFNVLNGDMSLVGPRPHAPRARADGRIYAEIMPDYMLRYRVRPGMTGWAQVNGWRGNTDTEEKLRKRVEFDFDYIRSWSFGTDLAILLRTLPSVLAPAADNH